MSLSVKYGQEPVLRLFLERGMKDLSHLIELDGLTDAAIRGYGSVFRLLLAFGWQPDPLLSCSAVCWGHLSVSKLLVEAQPDLGESQDGFDPFRGALQTGNLELAQYFLHIGADPNSNLVRPLTTAAEYGHLEIVRLLFNHGADANHTTGGLESIPIYGAITFLQPTVVEFLAERTDFNRLLTCGYSRGSLLCVAAACGLDFHIMQLLEDGLPEERELVIAKNNSNSVFIRLNPLLLAARMGHEHTVKLFLERSTTGDLPIGLMEAAIESGNIDLVKMLLGRGMRIEAPTDLRRPLLLMCAICGGPSILDFALANGLKECSLSDDGTGVVQDITFDPIPSALTRLVSPGFALYQRGYSIKEEIPIYLRNLARPAKGGVSLDPKAEAIIDVLLSHGVDINSTTSSGQTGLLLHCADGNDARPVKLLLEKGASPVMTDKGLNTPLWLAVSGEMEKDGIRHLLRAMHPRIISRADLQLELLICEVMATVLKKWDIVMILQRFKTRLENEPWDNADGARFTIKTLIQNRRYKPDTNVFNAMALC